MGSSFKIKESETKYDRQIFEGFLWEHFFLNNIETKELGKIRFLNGFDVKWNSQANFELVYNEIGSLK